MLLPVICHYCNVHFFLPVYFLIYLIFKYSALKTATEEKASLPSFRIPVLASILDHDNHEMRENFRKFVSDPIMTPKYNIPLHEERDVALARLKRICDVSANSLLIINLNLWSSLFADSKTIEFCFPITFQICLGL